MPDLFSLQNAGNLLVLIFLQAVLGFDNLLYISIESKRAPVESQSAVRQWGIIVAVALRVVLLFVIIQLLAHVTDELFHLTWVGVFEGTFTFPSLVFLLGGGFIMYTAMKEILHMMALEHGAAHADEKPSKTAAQAFTLIVVMNLVFSFDSILSAIAITDVFLVLATAIVLSGVAMLVLADRVSAFLKRHRKYEVLGLFILLIVGVMLLGEGGHTSHMKLFGYSVEPLSKTTFYFSVFVLVLVDIVQSRYRLKLQHQAPEG